MAQQAINLGQIAAIHNGLTPPANRLLIWFDSNTSVRKHKTYNFVTNQWELISAGALYVNNRPLQIQVGAASPGTTFNGTVAAALDKILNATNPPSIGLSVNDPAREFGASTAATLYWTAYKASDDLTAITVDGTSVTPTGETQSGTKDVTLTPNAHNGFTASVAAGTLGASAGCAVDFYNKYFLFANAADLLSASAADISAACRAAGNQNLDGNSRSRPFSGSFNGEFAYHAFKASYGVPSVVADGLANNGFLSNTFQFTNAYGYVETFLLVRSGERLTGNHSIAYA